MLLKLSPLFDLVKIIGMPKSERDKYVKDWKFVKFVFEGQKIRANLQHILSLVEKCNSEF